MYRFFRQLIKTTQGGPSGLSFRAGQWRRFALLAGIYLVLWIGGWQIAGLIENRIGVSLWFLPAGLRFVCLLALGWSGLLLELLAQLTGAIYMGALANRLPGFASSSPLWLIYAWLAPVFAYAVVIFPLRRGMRKKWDIAQPTQGITFLLGALAASMLAALLGCLRLRYQGLVAPEQMASVLTDWLIGDLTGILTLAPVLLLRVWPRLRHYLRRGRFDRRRHPRPSRFGTDRNVVLIVVPALLLLLAIPWQQKMAHHSPLIALLLLLPLAWVALLHGLRGAVLAVALLDGGLVLLMALFDLRDEAQSYQFVMIAIALVGLWLGVLGERTRRAEASRRESETSFRATFEHAAIGIAMVSPQTGRCLRANRKLCAILGYTPSELLNKSFQEITHPDDIADALDAVRKLRDGEPSCTIEERYLHRDGSIVWVRVTVALVRCDGGRPDYFVVMIEDVTDRKHTEDALRVSEGALREAQRLAGVGNWTWDAQNGRLLCSQEVHRLCGRDLDAPPADLRQLRRHLRAAAWHTLRHAVDTCRANATAFSCDLEIERSDGVRRWVTVRGQSARPGGQRVGDLSGTVQDITELKRAAEALRELNSGLEQRVAQRTAELNATLAESVAIRQHLQIEIEQRRLTEQRLQSAQMTLNQATRIAALGAWSVELNDFEAPYSNPMSWSSEMYRLLGYSPDDVPTPCFGLMLARVHPADRPMFSPEIARTLSAQGNWQREMRFVLADGSERLLLESAEVVFDEAGRPTQIHGAMRDITLQRQAEIRLRHSETRLQMALKGANAGSYEWDFVGGADRCSSELGALYGLPAGVPPASYDSWCRALHPEDRDLARAIVDDAIAQGIEFEVEWRVNLPPDTAPRWMISRARPLLDEHGEVAGYLGLSIDITERKRGELRLRQYRDDLKGMVAEQTAQLVVANAEQRRLNRVLRLLSDCNVTLAHARDENELLDDLCRLVVQSGGYLMGGVWFKQDDAQKTLVQVAQYGSTAQPAISWDAAQAIGHGPTGAAIRTGAIQICADCRNDPRVQPWRELLNAAGCRSIVALPLVIDNKVIGAFALYSMLEVSADREEIKVLEELANNLSYGLQSLRARNELIEHQQFLEQRVAERTQEIALLNADLAAKARDAESANRAKSSFLSTMSHEIRTPLGAIVGLGGLLADSPLTRRQRDYAEKIRSAAQSLHALIDDILDFSKIEAGALRLDHAAFSLDAILSTVAVVVSAGTAGKPVETLFDIDPEVPDGLVGDAMRVQQILVNLAGNAAKFTDRGEVVVAVRCLAHAAERVTLEFVVRDSGIGIPDDEQDKIFDAFDQGQASTSRRYGGTGLGLAISARLAALMDSRITMSSRVGEGSEFRFAVTFEVARDMPLAIPANALPALRVLIVDDHPLARAILGRSCATFGWQANAVGSAAAGLAELRRSAADGSDYDVLLLDWRMPGSDGIEMLRQAQTATDIGLPLVILMVATFELERAVAASDGLYIDSLLAKPTTPVSLHDAVTRAHSGELVSRIMSRGTSSQALAGMRLLVAEDNDLNQLYIEQILSRAGAEVVVVDNGIAAVAALRSPDAIFDAVLMDIEMPQMGGYAAARIIRDELGRRELPIIAVTAYAQAEDFERSRNAGMSGHVVKPINENDLLRILARQRTTGDSGRTASDGAADDPATESLAPGGLPGINLAAAVDAFGGDRAKYAELLRRFVVTHGGDIDQARTLFAAGDIPAAAGLIHGVCGMASVVYAPEMAQLARAAEEALGNWNAVPPLLDELQNAMRALGDALATIDALASER